MKKELFEEVKTRERLHRKRDKRRKVVERERRERESCKYTYKHARGQCQSSFTVC